MVERSKHVGAFEQFTETLPPASIAEWKNMVAVWEREPASALNPYEYQRSRTLHHLCAYYLSTLASV